MVSMHMTAETTVERPLDEARRIITPDSLYHRAAMLLLAAERLERAGAGLTVSSLRRRAALLMAHAAALDELTDADLVECQW